MYEKGKLTALFGSNVPMTIEYVDNVRVTCIWFDKRNRLQRADFARLQLIGAGDELVFANGVFVRAQDKSA